MAFSRLHQVCLCGGTKIDKLKSSNHFIDQIRMTGRQ